jgi:hypothetical protein
MKRLIFLGLIVAGTSFAEPMPQQQSTQLPSTPMTAPSQPQPLPTAQTPTPIPPQTNSAPPNPMPPVEIKPEDKAVIDLKKKMTVRQIYNEYQKVDRATSIDRINLERSLREAKYALKAQMYKEKQLDAQLPHPYYYAIPIKGVVGNVALTDQTPLKDGTVLKGRDKIAIKDGLVYVGDYLISYPVMDHIKEPKIDASTSSSAPQLLTGLPTASNSGSPIGSPPIPLPLPPPR